jgi:DNA invertase Pin-like site-specific DNA recombinase
MKVLHSCDNPPCCNPHHLRSGTQLENVQDMHAKGRARKAKGLENGRAKLSDKQVAEIRYLRGEGIGPTELAKQFGISRYYVYCLISGTDRK